MAWRSTRLLLYTWIPNFRKIVIILRKRLHKIGHISVSKEKIFYFLIEKIKKLASRVYGSRACLAAAGRAAARGPGGSPRPIHHPDQ
jgi:hypothetical protein